MDSFNTPADILELANAFRASRAFLTAFEFNLFTVLESGETSAHDVAAKIRTDERATERLMNALTALGLLDKKEGRFSNTPAASKFLVKGKPGYMGGLAHTVNLWDNWSTMTEAVTKGTSVPGRKPISERGEAWLDSFITAMHMRAKQQAPVIISMLDLSGVSRVLDAGGGSGAFSFAFVNAAHGLRAVIFDLPEVIPLTQNYIKEEGYAGKVDTLPGNYLIDELGSNYDLVFLSAIIHSNSPDENRLLFSKCAKSLNPRGQLAVLDYIMNEDRTEPAAGALFALNMLVGTKAGDTFTETEVRSWMNETGFTDVTRKDTEFGTGLIIGRKK